MQAEESVKKNIWEKMKNSRLLFCMFFTVAAAVVLFSRYAVFFELDDIMLRNILSGLVTGEPEAHCYFIYYPLASLLAALYEWFPAVYWYLVFFLVVNYFSLFLILYRVMQKVKRTFIAILIMSVFFILLLMNQFVLLEWTMTAGTASAAAIFWYATISEDEKEASLIEYVIPVCLLWCAYNLRHTVVLMLLPFAALIFVNKIRKLKSKRVITKNIVFCFLCMIVVFSSFLINRSAYQGDEWQEAIEMGNCRSMLFDYYGYPDYDAYEQMYLQNGITRTDYEAITKDVNFRMVASGRVSSENLKPIAEKAKELYNRKMETGKRIWSCLRTRLGEVLGKDYYLYSIVLYAGSFILFLILWKKRNIWAIVLEILAIVIFEMVWMYLYISGRSPFRVGYGLYMGAIAVIYAWLWEHEQVKKLWEKPAVKIAFMFCLSILLGGMLADANAENAKRADLSLTKSVVKQYCEDHSENLYLRDYLSFTQREVIQNRDERMAANFRSLSEWNFCYPLDDNYIPFDQDLCNWIKNKDDVFFMVHTSRAEGMCSRQEELFASRGILCELVLEDELQIPNGETIQVFHYVCDNGQS